MTLRATTPRLADQATQPGTFAVHVAQMPGVPCTQCGRTVYYRSGTASEALTDHYNKAGHVPPQT